MSKRRAQNKKSIRYPTLKELFLEQESLHYGSRSFFGTGNYGVGNDAQLIVKNPATKFVKSLEDEEHNQNIFDQDNISRKWKKSNLGPIGPIEPTQHKINRGIQKNPQSHWTGFNLPLPQKLGQESPHGILPMEFVPDDLPETDFNHDEAYEIAGPTNLHNLNGALSKPGHFTPSDRKREIEVEMDKAADDYYDSTRSKFGTLGSPEVEIGDPDDPPTQSLWPYTTPDKLGDVTNIGNPRGDDQLALPMNFMGDEDVDPSDASPLHGMSSTVQPKKFVPDPYEGPPENTDYWARANYLRTARPVKSWYRK